MTWSEVPKADKNGVIINYKINVSLGIIITSASSSLLTVNDGNALNTEIPGLAKWSYYTMQIAASTIKGTSVYSSPVTQRTSQDSKYNRLTIDQFQKLILNRAFITFFQNNFITFVIDEVSLNFDYLFYPSLIWGLIFDIKDPM